MKTIKNNKYIRKALQLGGVLGASIFLLMTGLTTLTTGCQKARLFSHVDTLPGIPSHFHFFNAFAYDTSLNFSVDGKLRETIPFGHFSDYYPSASAFNQDPTQPNGKYIVISDPHNTSEFMGFNTIQFVPSTSYLVFPSYPVYDTLSKPLNTIVPSLVYLPEDVETPLDGGSRVRLLDLAPGLYNTTLSITPNAGAGTTLSLPELYLGGNYTNTQATYTGTQPGIKNVAITMNYNGVTAKFTFLPINFGNSNYTFLLAGDFKNFLAGLQPRPRLLLSADGNPSGLRELTLSSITYPGNLGATAQVTVINDAFNVPGILSFGDANAGTLIQYEGLDVSFGLTTVNVNRWPYLHPLGGDVEYVNDPYGGGSDMNVNTRMSTRSGLTPGAYRVNVVPGKSFTPVYGQFDVTLEAGIAYTVCLLPDLTTARHCTDLVLQNDNVPTSGQFRLRVMNLLAGSTQLDIHNDSPSGSLLASAVSYAQPTDYINLTPGTQSHNLYVTASGSTTPLFQNRYDPNTNTNTLVPMQLSYTGGNSGTLYIMGLLPGTPYSGDPSYFGPYAIYVSDASLNPYSAQPSSQLFF